MFLLVHWLVILLAICVVVYGDWSFSTKPWELNHRLQKGVVPIRYNLIMRPNIEEGNFSGLIGIEVNVTEPVDFIAVHAKDMDIAFLSLTGLHNNDKIEVETILQYIPHDFMVLLLESTLHPGLYRIRLQFDGSLVGRILGFYRSSYLDFTTHERKFLATTKFEPVHARLAFPCFDEPAMKATFKIGILVPSNSTYNALSNTVQESRTVVEDGKWLLIEFTETVKMPTYLVSFVISDFENVGPVVVKNKGGPSHVTFDAWASHVQVNKLQFARDAAVNIYPYYTEYFGVPFPMSKLDYVAIPDFVSTAVENWGLIACRQTAILFHENMNSVVSHKKVAKVVAHELAHQWFGNLVTMNWWNDLWLNEGFATFMEKKGIDYGLSAARTWKMGSAVIRMLEDFVGEDNFKSAIQLYLKRNLFGNTVTDDLWHAMDEYADSVNVGKVMATWTKQMGFPVVQAHRSGDQLVLNQSRFVYNTDVFYDEEESPFRYKWEIPINLVTSGSSVPRQVWMKLGSTSVTVSLPHKPAWVKLNHRQRGYYRVNYDTDSWSQLIDALVTDHNSVERADRAGLLDDSFQLAAAGYIGYDIPLKMAEYLYYEVDYLPLAVGYDNIMELKGRVRRIAAASNGLTDVCRLFKKWVYEDLIVHPDMKLLVYSLGMYLCGTETEWKIILEKYLVTDDPQEKILLLEAMTQVQDSALLKELLIHAQNPKIIREQDYFKLLENMATIPQGMDIVWEHYVNDYDILVKRFSIENRYFGNAIEKITEKFDTPERLDELEAFCKRYPNSGAGEMPRRRALEKVRNNIKWFNAHNEFLTTWFSMYI